MKDPADLKTTDMHPPPPPKKKRGRPSTGSARTAAERKRAQRKRDEARFRQVPSDHTNVTVTGMLERIALCATLGMPDALLRYAHELADRIREQNERKSAAEKP